MEEIKQAIRQRQEVAQAAAKYRLVDEQEQVEERLAVLVKLTKDDRFRTLAYPARELILEQCRVMTRYSMILEQRISSF